MFVRRTARRKIRRNGVFAENRRQDELGVPFNATGPDGSRWLPNGAPHQVADQRERGGRRGRTRISLFHRVRIGRLGPTTTCVAFVVFRGQFSELGRLMMELGDLFNTTGPERSRLLSIG